MSKIRISILSLLALALLIGQATVSDADAKVRVKVTLQTPNARVRISNTSSSYHRIYRTRHLPIRVNIHYRISQRDRAIAHRLARYTGVPRRELIQLRRQGVSLVRDRTLVVSAPSGGSRRDASPELEPFPS